MRLLALGGAGAMGRVSTRVAARVVADLPGNVPPGAHEVVIADRDLAAARRAAAALAAASPVPVRAARVDVTDGRELHAALVDADAVLNTVGPYYRHGRDVLRAAIRTGTHYLDICDDWEPTLAMLELGAEARAAGVRAVIGMGASPGISNLLAARAAARLDTLTDVHTAWPVDVGPEAGADTSLRDPDGAVSAAAVHWMQQISGTVATVEGGRLVRRRPLRPVTLDLPGGRHGTAYTVGHPEPVTLHRSLRPGGDAASLMVLTTGTAAYLDVLREDIDSGRLTNESAAADLDRPTVRRTLRAAARAPGCAARAPSRRSSPPPPVRGTGARPPSSPTWPGRTGCWRTCRRPPASRRAWGSPSCWTGRCGRLGSTRRRR
ncbi:saccharopine dehydrogenase NADP-binding domain-containing protein [Kitasatospora sp. NPDC056651]|uniref:saccharopine dehydrogenase NADP-binding domain-containing protein n=1 Tax=Kitasatospora sp. NPDC056651 TaxID=3345892 RepID=UPI0036C2BFCF